MSFKISISYNIYIYTNMKYFYVGIILYKYIIYNCYCSLIQDSDHISIAYFLFIVKYISVQNKSIIIRGHLKFECDV